MTTTTHSNRRAPRSSRCADERCNHILKKHASIYGRCNEEGCSCLIYRPRMDAGAEVARAALEENRRPISVTLSRDQWHLVRYLVASDYDAALRAAARAHQRNEPENYGDSLQRSERAKAILEVLNERTR